jgi:hypothetical protein
MDKTKHPFIVIDIVVEAVAVPITTYALKVKIYVPIGVPEFCCKITPFI